MVKVRGFSLRSATNEKMVTDNLMKSYIEALLRGERKAFTIGQWQIRVDPTTKQLHTVITGKKFSNPPLSKRAICPQNIKGGKAPIFQTLPLGWTNELLQTISCLLI